MTNINATVPRFHPMIRVPTSVPFTYRDGLSTLQLIECLKHNVDVLCESLESIKEWCEDEADKTDEEITAINNELKKVQQQIDEITDKLGSLDIVSDAWNVTKGRYTDSQSAMRDTYRELAVFGARVNQIANLTVNQLAEHTVDEISAVGNYTIFNNNKPRVTDPQTGEPYGGQ